MAELVVGGEIPVVTSSINGPTVTYKNYGIQLEISPEVDQYDNIMGQVAVEVSALDLSNAVDGQPAFRKRSSKNDIRLAPGETLALAGLIQQEEQIAYSGIKWLQDIPLLGNLFRNKSFTSGKTELVILITPTEIEDLSAGANQKLIDRAQDIRSDFEELKYELSQYPKTRKTEEPEPSGSEQAGP
jgi:pilus assembly protein CpaC